MINLKSIKNIHFVGIGGIGMSAVARMMLHEGKKVSGSDREETEITEALRRAGATIFIGHNESNISSEIDTVIYTIAVSYDNPEIKKANTRELNVLSYPEFLGVLSRNKFTIAVSGTHGKTTTTAMIAKILTEAKRSPTVIVGSLLKESGTNFIPGEGNIFVIEACEYRKSFLHLNPSILVITNIDNDHLDYYKDITAIQAAFKEFAGKMHKGSYIVANLSDQISAAATQGVKSKVIDYDVINGDILKLRVPGLHNISNAKAALGVAKILNIRLPIALKALAEFKGTWRRFEYKGKIEGGAEIYDDYAHHPTEIKATLEAAKSLFPSKKLIVVFQPHLHSRTKLLLDEFAQSFAGADELIVAPIYAAREDGFAGINSWILAERIRKYNPQTTPLYNFNEIAEYIKNKSSDGDVVILMGAGDIYKVADSLVEP